MKLHSFNEQKERPNNDVNLYNYRLHPINQISWPMQLYTNLSALPHIRRRF